MADQRLKTIEIEGFTSIRSARVELGSMNVLIGANGAGKSNFIQALGMLGRMVDRSLGLFVGLNGGASALLNASADSRIRLHVDAPPLRYRAALLQAADDQLIFGTEEYLGLLEDGTESPQRSGFGSGHNESLLVRAANDDDPYAMRLADLLSGCRVFHFDDTSRDSPVKRLVPTADNLALRDDAENLAAVLLRLKDSDRRADHAAYRRITGAIRLVAPFFQDFVLEPDVRSDRVRLRWLHKDFDKVFSAEQLSDGTLRFVCLATLLLQPKLPHLVVLDEPELGLHPFAIVLLAGLLRQAATRSQVVIATQSVTLMNQFAVEDLIVVEQQEGNSVFTRPDSATLASWLDEYSLGDLWEKNIIGGQPGSTGSVLDD